MSVVSPMLPTTLSSQRPGPCAIPPCFLQHSHHRGLVPVLFPHASYYNTLITEAWSLCCSPMLLTTTLSSQRPGPCAVPPCFLLQYSHHRGLAPVLSPPKISEAEREDKHTHTSSMFIITVLNRKRLFGDELTDSCLYKHLSLIFN